MSQNYNSSGRDQINIGTITGSNVFQPHDLSRSRNEYLLLKVVKEEITSRLDQSLHQAVFINLGKQLQPEQVEPFWNAEVKIGSKPAEPLSSETTIIDTFERSDIAGKLLILGEPGSGKTTTMLDLAQALILKAEADDKYPIPVLLNLSSWKDPRQTLVDWLVKELKSKYGISKDIGKKWVNEKQLLPLLDGLDEVKPELQESCVQAINQWLGSERRPIYSLVCCRQEEYSSYKTQLELNGSILLQPLTDTQIQHYLEITNRIEIWQIFQQDSVLGELLRIPLLLIITVLSYEELSLVQWQQQSSSDRRLALLLDAYIQRMLDRKFNSKIYKKSQIPKAIQTRRWLTFLAKQLERDSQTEFLIENIQPNWLLSSQEIWKYKLSAGFTSGLILTLVIFLSTIFFYTPKLFFLLNLQNDLFHALQQLSKELFEAFINLLITGFIFGSAIAVINLLKNLSQPQNWIEKFKDRIINILVFGFSGILYTGLFAFEYNNHQAPAYFQNTNKILYFGIINAITFALIGLFLNNLSAEIKTVEVIQWSIDKVKITFINGFKIDWKYVKNVFLIGIIFGFTCRFLVASIGFLSHINQYTWIFKDVNNSFYLYFLVFVFVFLLVCTFVCFGYIYAATIILRLFFTTKKIFLIFKNKYKKRFLIYLFIKARRHLLREAKLIWNFKIYILIGSLLLNFIMYFPEPPTSKPFLPPAFIYLLYTYMKITDTEFILHLSQFSIYNIYILTFLKFIFVNPIIFLMFCIDGGLIAACLILVIFFGSRLFLNIVFSLRKGFNSRIPDKTFPNQGIWRSFINSGFFGIISGIVCGLISLLILLLLSSNMRSQFNNIKFEQIVPFFITIGCLIGGRNFGGATCIQHFTLRSLLYYKNYMPWNYASFLDHATERLFLQRVGGRYRFIHRLLQEHFAAIKI